MAAQRLLNLVRTALFDKYVGRTNDSGKSGKALDRPACLSGLNPYKASAGAELDTLIHENFFAAAGETMPYSTDNSAAEKLRNRLKSLYGFPIETGQTRSRRPTFFARFDNGPSTSTEVLAENYPLAICRLALVIASKHSPATE
ncbi:MAG TPA: hypothetical protein VGR78_10120 [Verrucomicrobiae bacterium]|jgi:hypothetical protein|nr:hypothetical protein [Verrucomicrobiae bacterium]